MKNLSKLFGVGVILSLVACSTSTTTTTTQLQQAAQDAQTVIAGLQVDLPTIETQLGVGSAASLKLANDFAAAQAAATALASATAASGLSTAQTFEAAINSVLSGAGALNLTGTIATDIQAAEVLAPIVESILSLVAAAPPPPGQMTPDQARLVLLARAKTKP
jgi:hypothetical protein